jgi:hypothetical protein
MDPIACREEALDAKRCREEHNRMDMTPKMFRQLQNSTIMEATCEKAGMVDDVLPYVCQHKIDCLGRLIGCVDCIRCR